MVLRARSLAALARNDDADVAYQAAQQMSPGDIRIQMERHRNRAYMEIDHEDFQQAANHFAAAIQFDPQDVGLWFSRAKASLTAGDVVANRKICREMVERFKDTTDRWAASRIVAALVDRPIPLTEMDDLLKLANLAGESYLGASRLEGAAFVRAGRYQDALAAFADSARFHAPNPVDWSFQAMALCRVGRISQAQECIRKAVLWIDEADQQKLPQIERNKPSWSNWSWHERGDAVRVLEEAKALMASKPNAR
jgi:tetratricopeptide (TPR) repeat protein